MNITLLTECRAGDFARIEALVGVLSSSCKAGRDVTDELLSQEGTHLFVARDDDGAIVGMTTLCCFTIPTGRHATIEDVSVLPEFRGRGLGRRLVQAALDYLASTGKHYRVGLTSRPSRMAANALYRNMGFSPKETNVYTMDI